MSSEKTLDFAIIGAGLTGLSLGWDLINAFPNLKLEIFEKSKSCGGRMATRRIESLRFDHGASFIHKTQITQKWIELWKKAGAINSFPTKGKNSFYGKLGMTDLAKALAAPLQINYNERISYLKLVNNKWHLNNHQGHEKVAKNLIITPPLVQTLELLKASEIPFNPNLLTIQYSCALVLLITSQKQSQPDLPYREGIGNGIFSICAQHAKMPLQRASWSIVMDASWSKNHFNLQDKEIIEKASQLLVQQIPDFLFTDVQVKKWKYALPLKIWPRLFDTPAPNLYIAGDSFGGPSLSGSLRSSQGLFKHLLTQLKQ